MWCPGRPRRPLTGAFRIHGSSYTCSGGNRHRIPDSTHPTKKLPPASRRHEIRSLQVRPRELRVGLPCCCYVHQHNPLCPRPRPIYVLVNRPRLLPLRCAIASPGQADRYERAGGAQRRTGHGHVDRRRRGGARRPRGAGTMRCVLRTTKSTTWSAVTRPCEGSSAVRHLLSRAPGAAPTLRHFAPPRSQHRAPCPVLTVRHVP
jgi:hypothetical protein